MCFEKYLREQLKKHPSAGPQDVVKQCYQAAYGAEHLLSDKNAARAYLEREFSKVEAKDTELYEEISENVCRVSLPAWKYRGLSVQWLFEMFAASSDRKSENKTLFLEELKTAGRLVEQGDTGFSKEEWQAYLAGYEKAGMPSVHHSVQYRACEQPAYRIIESSFIRLFPILEKAAAVQLRKNGVCVIAIDGRAASGKTTMADQLKVILGADIVRMDDFFLPPELRTQARLNEPGGNVHYERFIKEVLPHISASERFSYRRFDCGRMEYDGWCRIESTGFRIAEGSYSCHPCFGRYADITVFSDVQPDEQIRRIQCRNGSEMAKQFFGRWIPMEENYFECFQIAQNADLRV